MRTYIDSGVLITAARGEDALSSIALAILADAEREFVSSQWVKLEVLPKAIYLNRKEELDMYNLFFEQVTIWVSLETKVLESALEEASRYGLSAIDALHVSLAVLGGCDELITSERPSKPIHRTQRLKVTSLYPDGLP